MWLATTYGFFSICCAHDCKTAKTAKKPHATRMMIRARSEEHLKALRLRFPNLPPVTSTPQVDYPFRIIADRGVVFDVVSALVAEVRYTNFKNEVKATTPEDEAYQNFLAATWREGCGMDHRPAMARLANTPEPVYRYPYSAPPPQEGCPCGGSYVGDGVTMVRHCEYVDSTDEDCLAAEPDAEPIKCTLGIRLDSRRETLILDRGQGALRREHGTDGWTPYGADGSGPE